MGTVGCLLHLFKTHARVTFPVRTRGIRNDGRLFPDRFGNSLMTGYGAGHSGQYKLISGTRDSNLGSAHQGGVTRRVTRSQSTRAQAAGARPRPRASTQGHSAQVSEEKGCANKQMHSCLLSEHPLASGAAAAAITPTSKVPPPPARPRESTVKSGSEVVCESDRNIYKSLSQDSWTFYRNVSDDVRWNQRLTHTYDSCFLLPDTVSDALRISEGKGKIENELDRQFSTSLPVGFPSSEIQASVGEQENVLHGSEGSSAVSSISGKKSAKIPKKKKVIAKRPTTNVNKGSLSPAVGQKTMSTLSKKKVLKSQSKQLWSGPEVSVLEEEEMGAQEGVPDAAAKPPPAAKAKKATKKHKKVKKDEEKYFKEINLGMLNRAAHTLLYYRQCAHHSTRKDECHKVSSIEPYNLVLQGYANKRNIKKMKELFKYMKEDGVKPTETTYALLLSCLGRQGKSAGTTESIRVYLDDMKDEGITVQDVFRLADVLPDDVSYALQAVTLLDPGFEVEQVKVATEYSCSLVNELNKTIHSTKMASPAQGVVTPDMLSEWVEEQFALEASSELVINSIEKKKESEDTHHYRKVLDDWEEQWRGVLHQTFINQLAVMKKSFYGSGLDRRMSIYPYLQSLPADDFINVMMQIQVAEAPAAFPSAST
ncbi:DNA-directed RNA polymerase, mitochondrial [Chionoecetes opilio]|uniref:DNA-directed RNA polymerase, mitochondrial n=1 Tax=Chionoecetes opilio TaxID=41210 RepID=A0A8J4YAH8_CHIOP|nr:DNA-directed RNA polymerase, mitochondrial [Chionoecetes opilio]